MPGIIRFYTAAMDPHPITIAGGRAGVPEAAPVEAAEGEAVVAEVEGAAPEAEGAAGARAQGCPDCACFAPGTLVLMANGSTKPIEEVGPGDRILADDPKTPEPPRDYLVAATKTNWTQHIVLIEVDGSTAPIEATGEHPFWTENSGWVAAKALRPGDILLSAESEPVRVSNVTKVSQVTPTYNLSVSGVHTFFVVVGDESVLVHNQTPLNAPGYWNYLLVDSSGTPYYTGYDGPRVTEQQTIRRHTRTGRLGPTDRLVRVDGTRTYGEARILEHENALKYKTYTGKTPEYRGNRQNPIGPDNAEKYYPNGGYKPCP
jgi:hypothetical protein